MSDISRRRRFSGRALLGAAVLALPLTASITYAEIPAAPQPLAPRQAPEAPLDPAAPALLAEVPEPPQPPLTPDAPEASEARRVNVMRIRDGQKEVREIRKVVRGDEVKFYADGRELSEEEFEAKMEALSERIEGLGDDLDAKFDEKRVRMIEKKAERMAALAPEVRMSCEGEGITSEATLPDGKRVIRICERRVVAHARAQARSGLQRARDQIARNTAMSESVRAEVLAELDAEIARIEKED
jgi:hypothetical protein